MAGLGNSAENSVLDLVFGGVPYPYGPATKLSLHTGDPSEVGANEVVGGSYVRQTATLSAAVAGVITVLSNIDFPGMPAVTVTHIGFWTATGQFIAGGPTTNQVLNAGNTYRVDTGTTISLD